MFSFPRFRASQFFGYLQGGVPQRQRVYRSIEYLLQIVTDHFRILRDEVRLLFHFECRILQAQEERTDCFPFWPHHEMASFWPFLACFWLRKPKKHRYLGENELAIFWRVVREVFCLLRGQHTLKRSIWPWHWMSDFGGVFACFWVSRSKKHRYLAKKYHDIECPPRFQVFHRKRTPLLAFWPCQKMAVFWLFFIEYR